MGWVAECCSTIYFALITSMHVFLSLDESSAFVEVGARELCSWEKEREREESQNDVSGKHSGAQISSY